VLISRNDPWGIHRIPKAPQKAKWIHRGNGAQQALAAAAFAAIKAER
jgi:hypothetical protein